VRAKSVASYSTHKDRLLRFGADLVFTLCEQFAAWVAIINASKESKP